MPHIRALCDIVLLWLARFAQHSVLHAHPCCLKWQGFLAFRLKNAPLCGHPTFPISTHCQFPLAAPASWPLWLLPCPPAGRAHPRCTASMQVGEGAAWPGGSSCPLTPLCWVPVLSPQPPSFNVDSEATSEAVTWREMLWGHRGGQAAGMRNGSSRDSQLPGSDASPSVPSCPCPSSPGTTESALVLSPHLPQLRA